MTNANQHYKKMTETPLARLIISLGLPTTVSMLVTSIYNMADTYFVGGLGESPQAATGVLFALQAIIQAIAFMLGQGSGTMVSKSLAEKNLKEADSYVSTAFFTSLFVGTLITVLGLLFLTPMLYLLGSTETILPFAKQYGICVLASCPFCMASFVLNNNLRYEGISLYAMFGLVSGGILNIFGDWLLVYVLKMGILGAGIATAVSQFISFTILLVMFTKKAQSKIKLSAVSKKLSYYLTITRVGFPALIRQGLSSFSNGLLNNLTKPYGDAAIAAMSVVHRITMFIMCVGLGIGQGFQPVASFNYQAKKIARVKRGLVITMAVGLVLIGLIAAPCFVLAPQIVGLFQKSEQVAKIAVPAMRYACASSIFLCFSVPINMLYQSTRQVGKSSFLSLLRSGLAFIPTLLITTHFFGVLGIQISQPLADVLTGLISIPFIISFLTKKEVQQNEI